MPVNESFCHNTINFSDSQFLSILALFYHFATLNQKYAYLIGQNQGQVQEQFSKYHRETILNCSLRYIMRVLQFTL